MSEELKVCTKCGTEKPLSEFRVKKRKTGAFPASRCKDCTRADQREAWVKNGKPRLGWSKVPYECWTEEMRAAHLKRKEEARRKEGAKSAAQIEQERQKRAQQRKESSARRKAEREAARKVPVGLSGAEAFRWRYRNDPEFREKQKARTIQSKRRVPLWYANQQLGGTSERRYPMPLLLAKQMQLRIRHQLKEQSHEEH